MRQVFNLWIVSITRGLFRKIYLLRMQGLVWKSLSWVVLLLGLQAPFSLAAQDAQGNYSVQHYSIEQGLSARSVNCFARDPLGFIWVGTEYGLNRFDGYEFLQFTPEASGLRGGIITEIQCLKDHSVWYCTKEGGLGLLDGTTLEVVDSTSPRSRFPFDPRQINRLFGLNDSVMLATGPAVGNWLLSGQGWKRYGEATLVQVLQVIVQPQTGDHYFIAGSLPRYMPAGTTDHSQQLATSPISYFIGAFLGSYPLANTWDTTNIRASLSLVTRMAGGLPSIDTLQRSFASSYSALDKSFLVPQIQKYGNHYLLWYDKAINVLDAQFHTIHKNILVADDSRAFSTIYRVTSLGDIALIATNNGFLIVQPRPNYFRNFLDGRQLADRRSVRAIDRLGDSLLVASYHGYFMVHVGSGMSKKVQFREPHSRKPFYLMGLTISSSTNGARWIGDRQAIRWSPETGVMHRIGFSNPSDIREVRNAWEGADGKVWLCTTAGLYVAGAQDTVAQLAFPEAPQDPLNHTVVYGIQPARDGQHWWICSGEGLVSYHVKTKERKWYKFIPAGRKPAPVKVYRVHEDDEGFLWVGTQHRGLIRMNVATGEWNSFGRSEGLSNETIYAVVEDKHQRLWLTSDYGLMAFGKRDGEIRIFHKEDGISEEEFNSGAFFEDREGRFYFGTVNGVVSLHPDSVRMQDPQDLPLRLISILQVQADDTASTSVTTPLPWKPGETLYLPASDNAIEIRYALLDWRAPGQGFYSYRVEGLDNHWRTTSANSIRLDAWPSGSFKIRIRAKSPRGNWLPQEILIPVHVALPFYRSIWFILLVISLPFVFVYIRFRSLSRRKAMLEREVAQRTEVIRQDKVRLEEQARELAKLDEAKSRFFANVSHELRTPLTLILGPINAAIRKLQPGDPVLDDLSVVKENSKNLLSSIEEMLDISKMDSGVLVLVESPIHLPNFLKELTEPFENEAKQRGLTFEISMNVAHDLVLKADKTGLWRILTNLLSNAFKFTRDGGTVKLAVQDTGGFISFAVTDSGKGIDPEELPFIFDRYYQAKEGKAYMGGGSGIGLALAKEYADLMHGRIEVTSKHEEGAHFVFWMPKTIAKDPEASIQEHEDRGVAPSVEEPDGLPMLSKRHTLLVTEDNPQLSAFLASILETDHHVLQAVNGADALSALADHPEVSLILTDLMMPVMDGFALIQALKSDPRFLDRPVVVLTARAGREDRLRVLNTGVDDYITKPFDEEELRIRIRNLLHRVERKREPEQATTEHEDSDKEPLNVADLAWLHEIEAFVRGHVADERLSREFLADHLSMGDRTMTRRLNKATGMGPAKYIQEIRLQVGRELLESGRVTSIKQAAMETGFDTPAYFSKLYKLRFGKEPILKA